MPDVLALSPDTLLLVFAAVAFAGLVHGVLGLGFAIVATALVALLTDIKSAIVVSLLPTLLITAVNVVRGGDYRRSLGRFWFLPLYMVAGSFLGARLLMLAGPAPFTLLLALVIIAFLNLERVRAGSWSWVARWPRLAGAAFGIAAGLSESTANVSAPPLLIYFLSLGTEPRALVQTINLCFFAGKSTQTLTLAASGGLHLDRLADTLPFAGIALVTMLLGSMIRERVDAERYRRWLRILLWVVTPLLLAQFVRQVVPRDS